MRVLALDTTTRAGSVALVDDDRVLIEERGDPARSHAERLPGDSAARSSAAGSRVADIDRLRGRGRTRIVHRPAHRHRDDSGTGVRDRQAGRAGLRARRRSRSRRAASEPAGRDRRRVDGRASPRSVQRAVPDDGSRRRFDPDGLIEIEGAAVGDPAATLRRWETAGHAARRARRRRRDCIRCQRPGSDFDAGAMPLAGGHRTDGGGSRARGRHGRSGGGPAAVRPAAGRGDRARQRSHRAKHDGPEPKV